MKWACKECGTISSEKGCCPDCGGEEFHTTNICRSCGYDEIQENCDLFSMTCFMDEDEEDEVIK